MGLDQNTAEERTATKLSLLHRTKFFVYRFGFVLLALVAIGCYQIGRWSVYQAHPELTVAEQANAILAKVAKLIQLPQGETPTMATINDAAAVKNVQPFLANAENGDVLIVYSNAKTALLYRPSINQLIAVGPVAPGVGSEQGTVRAQNTLQQATTTSSKNAQTTPTKK